MKSLGIVIAAAIGVFSTALERRLRRARREAESELLKGRETLLLQERLRLAGQLASGIAHDLNNTLNVVKMRLAALSQDEAVRTRHAARLQALDHAIDDAARTIARVRELGKRREEIHSAPAQLCEIIAQAIDLARSSIEARSSLNGPSIRISSNLPDQLPMVKGPAPDLRQVFLNLLLNAGDAIHDSGRNQNRIRRGRRWLGRARVSTTGPGIPDRAHRTGLRAVLYHQRAAWHRLGLSMAREIMEDVGGSICAANQPGRRSVFRPEVPVGHASRRSSRSVRRSTGRGTVPLSAGRR